MIPEPLGGLAILLVGWLVGKVDRWTDRVRSADEATSLALAKLAGSMQHLDSTLIRLDASLDRLWVKHDDHEHRISMLEGGK